MDNPTIIYGESGAGHESLSLKAIWDKFRELLKLRDAAYEQRRPLDMNSDWVVDETKFNETVLDPICDELYALAWLATNIPARTSAERRYKAEILKEFIEEREDDVLTALANSLSSDCVREYQDS